MSAFHTNLKELINQKIMVNSLNTPVSANQSPKVMVDIVIFTLADEQLKVLLIKRHCPPFQGDWALPGGGLEVDQDQSLQQAAMRELWEETGVENHYLEQIGSYGGPHRDPRGWTLSVVYFALVAAETVSLKAGSDAAEAQWYPIQGETVRPRLAFDHADILQAALYQLRKRLEWPTFLSSLLPTPFTITDLHKIYEIILQTKIETRAFAKWLATLELITKVTDDSQSATPRYQFAVPQPAQRFFPFMF